MNSKIFNSKPVTLLVLTSPKRIEITLKNNIFSNFKYLFPKEAPTRVPHLMSKVFASTILAFCNLHLFIYLQRLKSVSSAARIISLDVRPTTIWV